MSVAAVILVAVIGFVSYWMMREQGIGGANKNTNRNTNVSSVSEDTVEYSETVGTTCPLNIRFRKSRTSPDIVCNCPEGYVFDQTMIGGESCYDGAECPIFAVECVAE